MRRNRIQQAASELPAALDEFGGFCPVRPEPWDRPYLDVRQVDLPPERRGKVRSWRAGDITLRTRARTKRYENAVRGWLRGEWGRRAPMEGDVRFEASFVMRRPAANHADETLAAVKPDVDNLARSFLESLDFRTDTLDGTHLGVLGERSMIAQLLICKRWEDAVDEPHTDFALCPALPDAPFLADLPASPSPCEPRVPIRPNRVVAARLADLPPAPVAYARYWDIEPVAWQEGEVSKDRRHVRTPFPTQHFQEACRTRAMRDYWRDGIRAPMDGPLCLEVEVLYRGHPDDRWRRAPYAVLLDYCKSLMDVFDFKRRTDDERPDKIDGTRGYPLGVVAEDSRIACLNARMRACGAGERTGLRFSLTRIGDVEDIDPLFTRIEPGSLWG